MNISSDQIMIYAGDEEIRLERNGVDIEIWEMLVGLDRKYSFWDVLVLNGPWGFTNLRVWSLALNLLKTLKNGEIVFSELSKPELYKQAYERGFLPRYVVLYIGQKSNVWLWDLKENHLVKPLKKQDLSWLSLEIGDYALDMVFEKGYYDQENQILISFSQEGVALQWRWKVLTLNYEGIWARNVEKIVPNYMIAPNVW